MRHEGTLPDKHLVPLARAVAAFRADHPTVSLTAFAVFLEATIRPQQRATDIAAALGISPTSLATTMSRLLQAGIVRSRGNAGPPLGLLVLEPHPEDGRAKCVALTDQGQQVASAMRLALVSVRT